MAQVAPLRWGILGAGWIAEQFTRDVLRLEDHRVVAVGSRTIEKANAFAIINGDAAEDSAKSVARR